MDIYRIPRAWIKVNLARFRRKDTLRLDSCHNTMLALYHNSSESMEK